MIQFKYISSLTEDELKEAVVVPCADEDGFSCILIKNSKNKILATGYSTDNLDVKINRVLVRNGENYYVHIIKTKKTDSYSEMQFNIIYEYVFKKIDNPIDDVQLSSLITSLEDYFKMTPEKNKRDIQIGVFGELFTIKHLYDCGFKEIVNKYHTNFYSKHDIEISNSLRLEVKTTTSEKRIHHFKHNQIKRNDIDVIVSSVLLEESKEGVSLKEMFQMVFPLFNNPDSIFALKKLMIKCGLEENECGMSFSFEKAGNEIKYFNAIDLPKIEQVSFEGITNIEYDIDCTNCLSYNVFDLISILVKS